MRVFGSIPLFARFISVAQTVVWSWSTRMCLALALGCAAMIAYGSGRPAGNNASELGLGMRQGVACFRGIVPGQTSWENATAALRAMDEDSVQQPSASPLDQSQPSLTGHNSSQEIIFYASQDGQKLAAIFIRLRPGNPVMVGDILTLYGIPTCVDTFYLGVGVLLLHYPNLGVLVRFKGTHFTPATPVSSIVLGHIRDDAPAPCNLQHVEGETAVSQRPWAGFAFIKTLVRPKK
jgi:hypothetical protein